MKFKELTDDQVLKMCDRDKEHLLQEISARLTYFYCTTNNSMRFPSSVEGDILIMVYKYLILNRPQDR